MISSHDRSGWFGASDTNIIFGSWDTKTFAKFWLEKLGLVQDTYVSDAMLAGTHYEHRILDHMGVSRRDRQIKKRSLRLRVNLDGESDIIYEVKTHSAPEFKVTAAYWRQAQVEMYAARKPLTIAAYRLTEADYINYYSPIDSERLSLHPVPYDPDWISTEYLPRLRYLSWCLKRRKTPTVGGWST